jgi:hypothetical protein
MRRGISAGLAAFAVMLVGAPSAMGATTIGSELAATADNVLGCADDPPCTVSQRSLPGRQLTAPTDGVIVRWRIKSGDSTQAQPVSLRVIRGTGANSTGVGSSQAQDIPAGAGTHTFPTSIPVLAGDFIGINCCTSPGNIGEFFHTTLVLPIDFWQPPLRDGETRAPTGAFTSEVLVNADLEPDCDNDGLGDETQDPELPLGAACGKGNRTLTLDANKNKIKKGKKVTISGRLSAAARQGPCESGQTIELQQKRPKQTTFATFAQVQTDSQGSFSLKKKVKKTFEFRAQVVETAACSAALSNAEKVKVKKRR